MRLSKGGGRFGDRGSVPDPRPYTVPMFQNEAQRLLWEQQIQNGFMEAARRSRACRDNHRYHFVDLHLSDPMMLHGSMRECVLPWFRLEYPMPGGVRMEVCLAPYSDKGYEGRVKLTR